MTSPAFGAPWRHPAAALLSMAAIAAAWPAVAGAWPPAPAKWLRSWDFGRDGDGEDTCTVRLRSEVVAGGYALTPRSNCRDVAGAARIRGWAPTAAGGIVFNDAGGKLVYGFTVDPHYKPRGWGFQRRDEQGWGWIMNATDGPPANAGR